MALRVSGFTNVNGINVSSIFTSSSEVRVGEACQPFSNVEFYRIFVTGIRLGQQKSVE